MARGNLFRRFRSVPDHVLAPALIQHSQSINGIGELLRRQATFNKRATVLAVCVVVWATILTVLVIGDSLWAVLQGGML